jgi:DNA-binding NtrC family response regulator
LVWSSEREEGGPGCRNEVARRSRFCFERANAGTLLLDEITEMRPEMQAKLLRVLEDKKISRLGGSGDLENSEGLLPASP